MSPRWFEILAIPNLLHRPVSLHFVPTLNAKGAKQFLELLRRDRFAFAVVVRPSVAHWFSLPFDLHTVRRVFQVVRSCKCPWHRHFLHFSGRAVQKRAHDPFWPTCAQSMRVCTTARLIWPPQWGRYSNSASTLPQTGCACSLCRECHRADGHRQTGYRNCAAARQENTG